MSLVEDVMGVLPFLRREAEALMLDTCDVYRPGGAVTDPDTGVASWQLDLRFGGQRCKVQQTISQASNPTAGGHRFTVQDSRIDFPVDAGPLAVNDVVIISSSVLDPQLSGATFRVVELFHKSMATAQRTRVEQVVA